MAITKPERKLRELLISRRGRTWDFNDAQWSQFTHTSKLTCQVAPLQLVRHQLFNSIYRGLIKITPSCFLERQINYIKLLVLRHRLPKTVWNLRLASLSKKKKNQGDYFKSIHAVICIVFFDRKAKEIGTSPRGHVELKEGNYRFVITGWRSSWNLTLVLKETLSDKNC